MQKIMQSTIDALLSFREWFLDFFGPALPWLQIVAIVISAFFAWGIIYSVSRSGYVSRKIETWMDMYGVGSVERRRQLKAWHRIMHRVSSNDMNEWKTAIVEADKILDDIIKASGYRGANPHERFEQLPREALSNRDQIEAAHLVRDRIVREPEFGFTQTQAVDVLKEYQKAFQELGLLD